MTENWVRNVMMGLDQLANSIGGGRPDETLSSRTGRTGLGNWLDRLVNRFQVDHSVRSVEYTPWGTVDPHHIGELDTALAADWDKLIQVATSPQDVDVFTEDVLEAADRAAKRLRYWMTNGGKERWGNRMARDICVGDEWDK